MRRSLSPLFLIAAALAIWLVAKSTSAATPPTSSLEIGSVTVGTSPCVSVGETEEMMARSASAIAQTPNARDPGSGYVRGGTPEATKQMADGINTNTEKTIGAQVLAIGLQSKPPSVRARDSPVVGHITANDGVDPSSDFCPALAFYGRNARASPSMVA